MIDYIMAALEREVLIGMFIILFFGIACLLGGIKLDHIANADAFSNNRTLLETVAKAQKLDVEKGYRNCILVPAHQDENIVLYVCKSNP